MLDLFTPEKLESIRAFLIDIVLPICTVLIPCIIGFYVKLRKEIMKSLSRFIVSFDRQLKDWEKEHSITMNNAITYYMDKEHANPYNRIDQIMLIILENGLSTVNNIHNMYWTVSCEDTILGRIPKKSNIQRVPYTSMIPVKDILDSHSIQTISKKEDIMAVPDVNEYPQLMQQPQFEGVGSALAVHIITPDGYLMGVLYQNYADPNYNDSDLQHEKESLMKIKNFIEGEVLSYNKLREDFIKKAKNI